MGIAFEQTRAAASAAFMPDVPDIPNINPSTGLSTDYLNHFTEAVMALEMLAAMPEFLSDLKAWRPKTYTQHFAASRFSSRNAVIAAYWASDPKIRHDFDAVSRELNTALREACAAAVAEPSATVAGEAGQRAAARLKPMIAQAAAIINGTNDTNDDPLAAQAAIDALFGL